MNELIQYFEHIPRFHRALILAGGITIFWLIESGFPLFIFSYNKWKHAGINFFFTCTTLVINFVFAFLIVFMSDQCVNNHFGILEWLHLPVWLELLAGLMLLDFIGAYCIHLIQHKVKWMWKFHMVHHSDTHVDTTTANRHHPGESIFRAVFTVIAVILTGVPIWMIMLYQTLSVVLAQFNHANINMPEPIDKFLRWIVVTPNMHRIHHHYVRPQTDTNYGNIFSCWDRIFATYHFMSVQNLKYGLDVLDNYNDEDIKEQLIIPFDQTIKTDY